MAKTRSKTDDFVVGKPADLVKSVLNQIFLQRLTLVIQRSWWCYSKQQVVVPKRTLWRPKYILLLFVGAETEKKPRVSQLVVTTFTYIREIKYIKTLENWISANITKKNKEPSPLHKKINRQYEHKEQQVSNNQLLMKQKKNMTIQMRVTE